MLNITVTIQDTPQFELALSYLILPSAKQEIPSEMLHSWDYLKVHYVRYVIFDSYFYMLWKPKFKLTYGLELLKIMLWLEDAIK